MQFVVALVLAGTVAAAVGLVLFKTLVSPTPVGIVSLLGFALLLIVAVVCVASLAALRSTSHLMRERVVRAWLVVLATTVTFVVCDLLLGALLVDALSPPARADRSRHHVLVPGTRSHYVSSEYDYVQSVNSLGLRGPEIEPQAGEGEYRVLLLGDSFTMGKGVSDSETFAAVLERRLDGAAHEGRRFTVLNGGVDSYAPILSWFQLQQLVPALDVDLVVLNVDMGDVLQEHAYRKLAVFDAHGRITGIAAPVSLRDELVSWLERHTFFSRRLALWVRKSLAGGAASARDLASVANHELLRHTVDVAASDSAPWEHLYESIGEIASHCRAHGVAFMLVIYPWGHQVSAAEWVPGRQAFIESEAVVVDRSRQHLHAYANTAGIALVDAFASFREHALRESDAEGVRLYFRNDMHWTPAGHRVMADVLFAALQARGLGSRAPSSVTVPD